MGALVALSSSSLVRVKEGQETPASSSRHLKLSSITPTHLQGSLDRR